MEQTTLKKRVLERLGLRNGTPLEAVAPSDVGSASKPKRPALEIGVHEANGGRGCTVEGLSSDPLSPRERLQLLLADAGPYFERLATGVNQRLRKSPKARKLLPVVVGTAFILCICGGPEPPCDATCAQHHQSRHIATPALLCCRHRRGWRQHACTVTFDGARARLWPASAGARREHEAAGEDTERRERWQTGGPIAPLRRSVRTSNQGGAQPRDRSLALHAACLVDALPRAHRMLRSRGWLSLPCQSRSKVLLESYHARWVSATRHRPRGRC